MSFLRHNDLDWEVLSVEQQPALEWNYCVICIAVALCKPSAATSLLSRASAALTTVSMQRVCGNAFLPVTESNAGQ